METVDPISCYIDYRQSLRDMKLAAVKSCAQRGSNATTEAIAYLNKVRDGLITTRDILLRLEHLVSPVDEILAHRHLHIGKSAQSTIDTGVLGEMRVLATDLGTMKEFYSKLEVAADSLIAIHEKKKPEHLITYDGTPISSAEHFLGLLPTRLDPFKEPGAVRNATKALEHYRTTPIVEYRYYERRSSSGYDC